MIGMKMSLTEMPLSTMKLIQGIYVKACNFINLTAVYEKTGANADQMIGRAKFLTGF